MFYEMNRDDIHSDGELELAHQIEARDKGEEFRDEEAGGRCLTEDQRWAIRFLRETEGHSCYVCRGGEADCGTIASRDEAWKLLRDVESVPVVVMDEDFPF